MKNTNKIQKSLTNGLIWGIGLTIGIVGVYAYTTGLGGKVKDSPLLSSDWNSLVANVDEVNGRFSFTGTNVIYSLNKSIGLSNGHLITLNPNGAMVFNSGPNDGSNVYGFWFRSNSILGYNSPYTDLMRLTGSGNLGIGTSNPTYKLEVNGQPAANGYTAFTNYSDRRLKENINKLNNGILEKIIKLNPSSYNYNDKYFKISGYDKSTKDKLYKGFIAQELKEIFPEMVNNKNINGEEYLDTDLSNLQIYIVKAIQELKTEKDKQIKTQQQQIEELKKEIELLKSKN